MLLTIFLAAIVLLPHRADGWTHRKAASGAGVRWAEADLYYSVDEHGLAGDGVSDDILMSVIDQAFATWEAVECALCHDPAGIACPPVACAIHPLGLRFHNDGVRPRQQPGLGCADTAPGGAQTADAGSNGDAATSAVVGAGCEQPVVNGNQVIFVDDSAKWNFGSGVYALTLLAWNSRTGVLADADVLINDAGYHFCDGACPVGQVDLLNTLVHEVGHFVGLDHSSVPTATMFASAEPGVTWMRSLEGDDLDGVCHAYRQAWAEDGCAPPAEPGCGSCAGRPRSRPLPWTAVAGLFLVAVCLRRRRQER